MSFSCEYFFAPQSPWAYLGHERLIALSRFFGVSIDLKPCDLRRAYRLLELKRWSEFLRIPLHPQPKFFPVPGDLPARLIIATRLAHGTDAALKLPGAIMRAIWAEERNAGDADTLAAIASECWHDGRALLQSAETSGVQGDYERFTDDAIAANVFGSPWYVFDGVENKNQNKHKNDERAFARRQP